MYAYILSLNTCIDIHNCMHKHTNTFMPASMHITTHIHAYTDYNYVCIMHTCTLRMYMYYMYMYVEIAKFPINKQASMHA